MNASQLARKMLQWELLKRQMDDLEAEIVPVIMEKGKSLTVGLVRATYSKGRQVFDYEVAGLAHASVELVQKHTRPVTNWSAVCKDRGFDQDVEIPVKSQGAPGVKLKLVGDGEGVT